MASEFVRASTSQLETRALLKQAFPELSEAEVNALCPATMVRDYAAGSDLFQEGEPGASLFVLGAGEADVIVHADDDQEILLDTLTAVTYFGEMALFGEMTRTATIRARTDCHTLELTHDAFMPIALQNPALLRNALRDIIGHVRHNDRAVIQELDIKNAALQEAYANLAEQEAFRTEFIATLSHELRTPLTAIRGFLSLINGGVIEGASLEVAIESITRNVEQLVGLTNELLILYEMHPDKLDLGPADLAGIVVEALNDVQAEIGDSVAAVSLNIESQLPQIIADGRTLAVAVREIIDNAFKFNPEKRPVRIDVASRGEKEVIIAVQDQGVGIPPAVRDRIFEPFNRLERAGSDNLFPGLGIGLTIARLMIARQNGRIEVASTPGSGSTFTICLPIHPPSAARAA